MEALKITSKPSKSGRISIRIPPNLRSKKLEMIVVFNDTLPQSENKPGKNYDFSNVAGRLLWKGNPVKEQRRLRNEW